MKRVDAKITMDPLGAILDPLGSILETQLVSDQPHTTTSTDQSADYLELDVLEQWKVFKKTKINPGRVVDRFLFPLSIVFKNDSFVLGKRQSLLKRPTRFEL